MGCFLTATERDLEQITSRMMGTGFGRRKLRQQQAQAAAAVWDQRRRADEAYSNKIESSSGYPPPAFHPPSSPANKSKHSAHQESHPPSSPTRSQQFLENATFINTMFPGLLPNFLGSEIGRVNNEIGNQAGEPIAAIVLEKAKNIIISHHSQGQKGFDLLGKELSTNQTIIVEVKTKSKEVKGEKFGAFLDKGYGHKQCSDSWIGEVAKRAGIENPLNVKVWGVHINPDKNTVSIYQRMNSDATSWKRIMNEISLADFEKKFGSIAKG